MNINLTLIGQSISFIVFVWVCRTYIWPPIVQKLKERQAKIADGLAAAEKGRHDEELAKERAAEILRDAKAQGQEVIRQAEKRAAEVVEEAKLAAKAEGDRMLQAAQAEIDQNINRAREELRGQVVSLAVAGARKVLKKEIDEAANADLIKDLAGQL